jgi:histidine kinase
LNNIGLFVGNVIDMLRMDSLDSPRLEHDLSRAMQQVSKATEIITHLRTFGRAAPAVRERVAINGVIENSISLLKEQLRLRGVRVDLQLSEENPVVIGNPIQLEQVLMNLIANARDAVSQAQDREITVRSEVAGERLQLTVSDTGPGIPTELQQRIFDPFFTTKEVGEGTGLGLSIVYGIISDHAGTISVISSPPDGATFKVELPMAPVPS